jgi:MEMO1 family protein
MRKAIAAGQFYESDSSLLKKQIESCFKNNLGPGNLPKIKIKLKKEVKSKNFIGLISPHAGYMFSGACASHGFKFLAETQETWPETFILLGPNHTGYANSFFSLSSEDFETPLGIVKNDTILGNKIIKFSQSNQLNLKPDEQAHQYEHSLEVQLPFLQFIYGIAKKDFKIVPIIISSQNYQELVEFAELITKIIKNESKSIGIIASSDFTHYGPNYGFVPFPFNKETKKNLYALDKQAINEILNLKTKEFHEKASKTTICGMAPITILTEIAKILKKKPSFLKYYTSGDIVQDYENAVGYSSIIFS